ncbi:tetratricopeptide repeat protein [Winogradskyella maritima]|uniref:Tetratricopeptide repeat protein n=1 Tax=Winogradskyella maritima TaxID=1517766 RepID=A0ABV8AMM3_9FLAO|nr:tetratricopeptide repeat protein [Winogradskyella maritima]
MKKLVTIIGALLISVSAFAQKNEIKTLEKALKNNNYSEAKTAAMAADALVGNMDDKTKAKFYFLKAQALYANGQGSDKDMDAAVASIDDLKELESKIGKKKYTDEASTISSNILSGLLTGANDAISAKNYSNAAEKFEMAYALSPKDTTYLYYAASSAVNDTNYDKALSIYLKLKEMGYTGISMGYYAINKETGEKEQFGNKTTRDLSVRSGQYIKPTDEKSSSKTSEIVKNIALIYVAQDKNDKALEYMSEARAENPDDLGLLLSEANVNLKMGNKEKFKQLMEEATSKDPNNAELIYNLGVLAAEGGDVEGAKKYYQKALAINPKYTDAYTNMAVVILDGEQAIVEEMNGLGTSSADNRRYDELRDKRTSLYNEAIPYLEKALDLKQNNIDAARTLMNIYSAVGETEKFKAMKQRVADMEAGN